MLSWAYADTVWTLADANGAHHGARLDVDYRHGVGIRIGDVRESTFAVNSHTMRARSGDDCLHQPERLQIDDADGIAGLITATLVCNQEGS